MTGYSISSRGDLRGDLRQRYQLRQFGLWMFLATVTMLFAAFTSAYIVRQSGSDWRPVVLPPLLWWNSVVLAASSGALEAARWYGCRRRWLASSVACGSTLLLGAGFIGGQFVAWRQMVAAGVYLPSSPHASFLYMMSGAHALHVAAALCVVAWGAWSTWRGDLVCRPEAWLANVQVCRTFWHYLGAVWLWVLFVLST